ncbi:hypothetical protein C0Q70_19980 [Pomacea canaliculata]|uniref:Protein Wnt n=1 Tax=Pomacea canaliculata TaxID=400727 RepID=A0A2T7NEA0_POMCA|nr:hypothetical protein C0Q70_19980 [Pomacea canaliculata]
MFTTKLYLGVAGSYQPIADELSHSSGALQPAGKGQREHRPRQTLTSCSDLPYLKPRQRELCALDKSLIHVLSEGASMGIEECQHQFMNRRWNCSTFNTTSVFGNILKIMSRETAYIYAISSAGVMYAVTRACAKGELLKCGCDQRVRRRLDTDGTFEWGGCSDNIRYGSKFSKDFVDANELQLSAEGLMNLWNNGAGRKVRNTVFTAAIKPDLLQLIIVFVLADHQRQRGYCLQVPRRVRVLLGQGLLAKTQTLPLRGRFLEGKVRRGQFGAVDKKRKRLKRVTGRQKRPTKKDLVYLRESPDFCEYNPELGSLGTRGRKCNKTSYGLDGCTLMCCGRGYYTLVQEEKDDCDCKFYWCCRVECRKCTHVREFNYCN